MIRIQRRRDRGWRLPPGAVIVSRPSLFGNPWTLVDAPRDVLEDHGIRLRTLTDRERREWCVAQYRTELGHGGLLGDWGGIVSTARWEAMADLMDTLPQELDSEGHQSIRPLFRHLLRDATALVCWCDLDMPCHADALIELLGAGG